MPAFLVAVVLTAIYLFIKSYWMWLLVAVGVLAAVGAASWFALNYQIRKDAREAELKETQRLEDLRNEPLADGETVEERIQKRYLETCSTSFNEIAGIHYQGGMQWRGRLREITRQHLRPALSPEQWTVASDMLESNHRQNLISFFERPIIEKSQQTRVGMARHQQAEAARLKASYNRPGMDGVGFERWCVDVLKSKGWNAEITKASGDQGADVIAQKGGRKVAIQCKYYTAAVGNKAVQEIHAAKSFYGANHAVVVAKERGYTKGAMALANAVGVKLLGADDLYRLDDHL